MSTISVHNVTVPGLEEEISFSIGSGSLSALITPKQEVAEFFAGLFLGLVQPAEGSVTVLGCDPVAASPPQLAQLRRKVAVVHSSGGLVSNLKVWENLVLPLEYHSTFAPAEVEERGVKMLQRLNYQGRLMELPGLLPLYRKRLVGMGRAMLTEPELIVYNGILSGLSDTEKRSLIEAALSFHREVKGRTSLFVTANPDSIRDIDFEHRILLHGEKG